MKTKKSTRKFLKKHKVIPDKKKFIKKKEQVASQGSDDENHKEQLDLLQETDPDFYKFLQENDQELLEFSDDEASEQDEQDDPIDQDEQDEQELNPRLEEIKEWAGNLRNKNDQKSLILLVKSFKLIAGIGESTEEIVQDWEEDTINEIVTQTLDTVPDTLNHLLGQDKDVNAIRSSSKWKKLSYIVKSLLSSLLKLMKSSTDSGIRIEMIKKSGFLIKFFACFPKLAKEFNELLLGFWATADESVRIASFLTLRKCCIACPTMFLDRTYKGAYKAINLVSNVTNSFSMTKLKFMNSCVVELSGLSLNNTYTFGFLGIRELALTLKSATTSSDFSQVHSWSFINSLGVWSDVICAFGNSPNGGENLKHLVYPLVQISIGALRLSSNSKFFPMHLLIIQNLLKLSDKTGVFIPLSSYLMEILSSSEITSKAKPSTLKPLDFSLCLSVPSGYLSTTVYQKGLFEGILNLFYDYFSIPSISFPESSVPIILFLKRWIKKSKNPYMNKTLSVFLEKMTQQAQWTEKQRSDLNISPLNSTNEWSKRALGSPLAAFTKKRKI